MAGGKPRLPKVLEEELARIAEEILIQRSAEARKVAALEIANKLLRRVLDLYQVGGLGEGEGIATGAPKNVAKATPPPVVLNPCKWCGQPGSFKPKPSKWDSNPGWLCPAHAALEAGESDSTDTKVQFTQA